MSSLKYAISEMEKCFNKAVSNAGKITKYYRINKYIIEISIAGSILSEKAFPAIRPLECSKVSTADLKIACFDSCSTGFSNESVPDIIGIPNYRGTNLVSSDKAVYMQGTIEGAISIFNREASKAFFWVPEEDSFTFFEAAAPFHILLNWWAMSQSMQLLHAAAVGTNNKGILLAGKNGKSTAAVSCMASGFDYAGDEHIFLDLNYSCRVYGVYSTAKLNDDIYKKLGWLPQFDKQFPQRTDQKNIWYIKENVLSKYMDIKAVLISSAWDSINSDIIESNKTRGLLALAPSMLYCHGEAKKILDSIEEFIKKVPVYELKAGSDTRILANTIKQFIDRI